MLIKTPFGSLLLLGEAADSIMVCTPLLPLQENRPGSADNVGGGAQSLLFTEEEKASLSANHNK